MVISLQLMIAGAAGTVAPHAPIDTIRVEVGSSRVDGRVYAPHAARVRVWVGPGAGRMRAEWINVLTVGDSAGRAVHRWVTSGTQITPSGDSVRWVLRQTYDAQTLAPYGIVRTTSAGAMSALRIDGRRVQGSRRATRDAPLEPVDYEIDRPGFVASASDLVPLAVPPSAVRCAPPDPPAPGALRRRTPRHPIQRTRRRQTRGRHRS